MWLHSLILILILLPGISPCPALAQGSHLPGDHEPLIPPDILSPNWYAGYNLTVGLAVKTVYFTVSERGSNIELGTLTNQAQITPSLLFATPFYYFTDPQRSAFGWYLESGYSSFKADRQVVGADLKEVDMGTSVEGEYLYITPVVFYNWGDPYVTAEHGVAFKFGIGVGLGYLQARGNIVLTESTNQVEPVNVDKYGGAVSVILDLHIQNIVMRIVTGGPSPSSGNRVYTLQEQYFALGYNFSF